MEMIAAAKMRKAVSAAVDTRAYSSLAWELLVNLSKTQKEEMPLLAIRPIEKILMIIITSNRGLCGSFNSNIIKKTAAQLKAEQAGVDVIGIGKKGADFAKKMGYSLVAAFTNMTDTPNLDDALPIAGRAGRAGVQLAGCLLDDAWRDLFDERVAEAIEGG